MSKSLSCAILALLTLISTACGRILLYSGPELPDDRVAILSRPFGAYSLAELSSTYIDGVGFEFKEVAALPGDHVVEATRVIKGRPYDCSSRQEFDTSGYDSCRDEREKDIINGKHPGECYTSTYTTTVTECTVPYTQYVCSAKVRLSPNEKYTFRSQGAGVAPMQLYGERSGKSQNLPCREGSSWTEYGTI